MSFKSYRKDVRDSLDPHLAVDPEDRIYLTDDMTGQDDDLVHELRKGRKGIRRTVAKLERNVGETLDPDVGTSDEGRQKRGKGYGMYRNIGRALDSHLAVDPEDRAYLLDDIDEDYERHGKRLGRKLHQKRGSLTQLLSGRKLDVVAVDGSPGADRALLYAARNLPKDHSLLLVHGTRLTWMRGNLVESDSDEDELRELENHYEELCTKAGRDCYFKHIGYGSTTNFGDQICRVAEKRGATSVLIGRRETVSNLRRTILGSSSQAVMNSCNVPVTIVGTSPNSSAH